MSKENPFKKRKAPEGFIHCSICDTDQNRRFLEEEPGTYRASGEWICDRCIKQPPSFEEEVRSRLDKLEAKVTYISHRVNG